MAGSCYLGLRLVTSGNRVLGIPGPRWTVGVLGRTVAKPRRCQAHVLHASRSARGVCEVVRCHVWLGQTKGAMTDGESTVRRLCSALLPG
jgi:hypothetical protein